MLELKKKIKLLVVIFASICVITGCCKKEILTGLRLSYTELVEQTNAWAILVDKNEPTITKDTLVQITLSDLNDYTYFLDISLNENEAIIIETEGLVNSDTISDFNIELKGVKCNKRIKNLDYLLNGVLKTEQTLVLF